MVQDHVTLAEQLHWHVPGCPVQDSWLCLCLSHPPQDYLPPFYSINTSFCPLKSSVKLRSLFHLSILIGPVKVLSHAYLTFFSSFK